MYESLIKHEPDSWLYIVAFDDLSLKILKKIDPERATIISLNEFENHRLLDVKDTRTRAEYCWTCTSSVIEYILDRYNVQSCTYLDADLFFYNTPGTLLDELKNGKTVLITEHRFSLIARMLEQKRAGRFCVQFITFTNTSESRAILKKWISQCIDWCYARYEDGKFGDQKYLDPWPQEYDTVHVLENHGGGIAPWNARQYLFKETGKGIVGNIRNKRNEFVVVFFHFHYVRFINSGYADIGWNRIPKTVAEIFYKPYIQEIIKKEMLLEETFSYYKMTWYDEKPSGFKETLKSLYKKLVKFNLIKLLPNGLPDRS